MGDGHLCGCLGARPLPPSRVVFTPKSSRSWQAGSAPDTQTVQAKIKQGGGNLTQSDRFGNFSQDFAATGGSLGGKTEGRGGREGEHSGH